MRTKSVPLKYKIIAYFAAWLVALFATDPNGKFRPLVWMFPLGLAAFNRRWGNDGGWGVLPACIAIYLVHGYFYFRSRSLRATKVRGCPIFGALQLAVKIVVNQHYLTAACFTLDQHPTPVWL